MALEWATFLCIELTISNHLSQCLLFLCHFKSLVALESASIWNGKWKTYVRRQTEAICECEGERTAKAERKQRKNWQPVFRSVRCMSTWMDVCVVMAMMVVIFPFFFSNGFARHAINRSSNSGRCVKRKRNCLYFVARKLKSNTESNETKTPHWMWLCVHLETHFSHNMRKDTTNIDHLTLLPIQFHHITVYIFIVLHILFSLFSTLFALWLTEEETKDTNEMARMLVAQGIDRRETINSFSHGETQLQSPKTQFYS